MRRSTGSKNLPKSTDKKPKFNDIQSQVKTKSSSKKKQTNKSVITNKQNHNHAKIIFSKKKSQTQPNHITIRDWPSQYTGFQKAIDRVFRSLDVFSKGKICSINITRNIPQPILYFLGSLFQKLRQGKQSMSRSEFQQQCLKIKNKSSSQDIRQFIYSTRNINFFCQENKSLQSSQKILQRYNRNYRATTLNTLNTLHTIQNQAKTIQEQSQQDLNSEQSVFFRNIKKQGTNNGNVRHQLQKNKKERFSELERFMKRGIHKTFKQNRLGNKAPTMATIEHSHSPVRSIEALKYKNYDRPLKMFSDKENVKKIDKKINHSIEHDMPLKYCQKNNRKDQMYIKQSHKRQQNQIDFQIQQNRQRIKYLQSLKTIQYSQAESDNKEDYQKNIISQERFTQQYCLQRKSAFRKDPNYGSIQSDLNYPLRRKSTESNQNVKIMRLSQKLDGYIKNNAERIQRSKYILQDLI